MKPASQPGRNAKALQKKTAWLVAFMFMLIPSKRLFPTPTLIGVLHEYACRSVQRRIYHFQLSARATRTPKKKATNSVGPLTGNGQKPQSHRAYPLRCHQMPLGPCFVSEPNQQIISLNSLILRPLICYNFVVYLVTESPT